MKKVSVKSLFDCFDYVADYHGKEKFVIISIQDAKQGGFGVQFVPTEHCKEVLTLQFDDAETHTEYVTLFSVDQAIEIIKFIRRNRHSADQLIVHCYAGQSRSVAVGAFAVKMLGGDNSRYFDKANPNRFVYQLLLDTWSTMQSTNQLFSPNN